MGVFGGLTCYLFSFLLILSLLAGVATASFFVVGGWMRLGASSFFIVPLLAFYEDCSWGLMALLLFLAGISTFSSYLAVLLLSTGFMTALTYSNYTSFSLAFSGLFISMDLSSSNPVEWLSFWLSSLPNISSWIIALSSFTSFFSGDILLAVSS